MGAAGSRARALSGAGDMPGGRGRLPFELTLRSCRGVMGDFTNCLLSLCPSHPLPGTTATFPAHPCLAVASVATPAPQGGPARCFGLVPAVGLTHVRAST